ncbi:DUF3995 domain-containing protein [bacterium]|nr:DUF3995 domain-containing protein [bacterium]
MARWAAILAIVLLAGVALLHFVWAFGSYWPVENEREFQATFWGEPTPIPAQWQSAVIGILLLLACRFLWATAVGRGCAIPLRLRLIYLWGLFAVLYVRGVVGYLPFFQGSLEPFITNNLMIYSPLCLILAGLGTIALLKREKTV